MSEFKTLNGFTVKDEYARGKIAEMEENFSDQQEKVEDLVSETEALKTGNYATPQMFGAAADGETDDTEAFQAAIDTGLPVLVPFGGGKIYRINGVLNFTNESAAFIKGDFLPWRSAGIIFGPDAYINADTEYFTMENIRIVYHSGSYTNRGAKAVYVENTESVYNADAEFRNCIFSYFDDCIIVKGRGLKVDSCGFTFSYNGVLINYNGAGDTNEATTDSIGGARAHIIQNTRFHGMLASCVKTEAGSTVTGFIFNDNLCDIGNGGVEFAGEVYSAEICNNVLNFSNTAPIKFGAHAEHIVIDGNVLYCDNEEFEKGYPASLIYAFGDGAFRAVTITNNKFFGCAGSAVYLTQAEVAEACIISKNVFEEVCKTGTVMEAPIFALKGMINCIVSENQFMTTNDGGYCVRTNASGATVTGNVVTGNVKHNENTSLVLSNFTSGQRFVQEY